MDGVRLLLNPFCDHLRLRPSSTSIDQQYASTEQDLPDSSELHPHSMQPSQSPSGVFAEPLKFGFVADVRGIDFEVLPPAHIQALRELWEEFSVLRFRGYGVTVEQLVKFTKSIGQPWYHPARKLRQPETLTAEQEILVISNAVPGGILKNDELSWHTDSWFLEAPPKGSILHAVQLPNTGGDTHFVDLHAIYEALPQQVRGAIEGQYMNFDLVYDMAGNRRAGQDMPDNDDVRTWPSIQHPIVTTGFKPSLRYVCVGSEFKAKMGSIAGMPEEESSAVLKQIISMVKQKEHQFEQKWQPADLILWDNHRVMHRRDTWPPNEPRIMHRTSTEGSCPAYMK